MLWKCEPQNVIFPFYKKDLADSVHLSLVWKIFYIYLTWKIYSLQNTKNNQESKPQFGENPHLRHPLPISLLISLKPLPFVDRFYWSWRQSNTLLENKCRKGLFLGSQSGLTFQELQACFFSFINFNSKPLFAVIYILLSRSVTCLRNSKHFNLNCVIAVQLDTADSDRHYFKQTTFILLYKILKPFAKFYIS